jgi:hypothetical protein
LRSARHTISTAMPPPPRLPPPPPVTAAMLRSFDTQGFFVVERVIDAPSLALLRAIADDAVAARASERAAVDSDRTTAIGDTEGPQLMETDGGRTFAFGVEKERPEMYSAILGGWAEAVLSALTPRSSLFHTEFVVKEGGRTDGRTRFGFHQDGGYTTAPGGGEPSPAHISVWCALDDMTADNGALRVLPFNRALSGDESPVTSVVAPRPGAAPQPMYQHVSAGADGEGNGVNLVCVLSEAHSYLTVGGPCSLLLSLLRHDAALLLLTMILYACDLSLSLSAAQWRCGWLHRRGPRSHNRGAGRQCHSLLLPHSPRQWRQSQPPPATGPEPRIHPAPPAGNNGSGQ